MTTTQHLSILFPDYTEHWSEVHAAGCPAIARKVARAGGPRPADGGFWSMTACSLREAVDEIAADFIAEGSVTLDEAMEHVHFAPCVYLPVRCPDEVIVAETPEAETPAVEAPEAPAAAAPAEGKFMACPVCGFAFKSPQARCNSRSACEKRAARAGQSSVVVEPSAAERTKPLAVDGARTMLVSDGTSVVGNIDVLIADLTARLASTTDPDFRAPLEAQMAQQLKQRAYSVAHGGERVS